MQAKELLTKIKIEAVKFQERLAGLGEPVFVHKQDCLGSISLKRTVENKPAFRVVYRQCEVCEAADSFKENYPDSVHIGW